MVPNRDVAVDFVTVFVGLVTPEINLVPYRLPPILRTNTLVSTLIDSMSLSVRLPMNTKTRFMLRTIAISGFLIGITLVIQQSNGAGI